MPFKPGNTEGSKSRRAKPYADMLRLALAAADGDMTKLRRIAEKHVDVALTGDMSAIKEIADRIDGKVPQGHGGDEDLPPLSIIVTGVPRGED